MTTLKCVLELGCSCGRAKAIPELSGEGCTLWYAPYYAILL